MNKKKILSVLIIIVTIISIGTGIWNHFTEDETSIEKQVPQGKMDLTLNDNVLQSSVKTELRVVESCQNWYAVKSIFVTNMSFDLYILISNISAHAGTIVYLDSETSQEEVIVYPSEKDTNNITDLIIDDIENVTYYDLSLYRDNGNGEWDQEDELINKVTPDSIYLSTIANRYILVAENLNPMTIYWVVQRFHLDRSTEKKYHYDDFRFTVEFLVSQVNTPAPE